MGTLKGPPSYRWRKERATAGQYAPNPPGHAGCNGMDNGMRLRKEKPISKPYLSWNCRLKLADMNVESLVIACHHRAVNTSLLVAHTARRSIRV